MRTVEVELEDVEATHRAHPRTYSIPRREVREALPLGCQVKLVFIVPDAVEAEYRAERMWCEVTAQRGDRYTGTLVNRPRAQGWLAPGDVVEFEASHVAAIAFEDEPAMAPLVGCSLAVLRDGAWPTHVLRVEPTSEHDSGWRIFADGGDHRVRGVTIGGLSRAWACLDSVIMEIESGAWAWDADAVEFERTTRLDSAMLAAANRGLGRELRPPPPAKLGSVVTGRVLETAPGFAQWLPPSEGHPEDSGWCFVVGDESQEYMDDSKNHSVVALARMLHLYPYVERVLGETGEHTWRWDDQLGDWTLDH